MISRSVARCVWRGDVRLARVLLFQHPWTQSLIRVDGEVVSFIDPGGFHDLHSLWQRQEAESRRKVLESEINQSSSNTVRARLAGRRRAIIRSAQLWNPLSR
eukprot:8434886-Pyramimonas_sp.AAC.1